MITAKYKVHSSEGTTHLCLSHKHQVRLDVTNTKCEISAYVITPLYRYRIAIAELNQYLPSFSDCAGPPRTEPPRFADFASERLRRTFAERVVDVAVPNLRFHLWRICALLR